MIARNDAMTWFSIVPEQVARHPVARAVANGQMAQRLRDFQTRMYLLQQGEPAAGDIDAAATVIAFGMRLFEQAGERTAPEFNVMRGALSALAAMNGRWSMTSVPAIDSALEHAIARARRASPDDIRRAWVFIRGL